MAKFRKKPVEIEAVHWNGLGLALGEIPEWFRMALITEAIKRDGEVLKVRTLEGTMEARPDDWIIRGVKGELYPCKPDIFTATYDPV